MSSPALPLLNRWFEEVWNKENESAIDEMMSPKNMAHGITDENDMRGSEAFKAFYHQFRSEVKKIHVEVHKTLTEGDYESARMTITGIHAETGIPIKFDGICMVYIKDGKISEAWNSFDFLGMYQQIGMTLEMKKK